MFLKLLPARVFNIYPHLFATRRSRLRKEEEYHQEEERVTERQGQNPVGCWKSVGAGACQSGSSQQQHPSTDHDHY